MRSYMYIYYVYSTYRLAKLYIIVLIYFYNFVSYAANLLFLGPLSFNMADPIVTEGASKGVKNLYLILNRTDLTPLHTFHVKLIYKDINFTSGTCIHIYLNVHMYV